MPPNPHGKHGRPDDHVPTVKRLGKQAVADFPDDKVHEGIRITGMKLPRGRKITNVVRDPDVWHL